MAYFERINSIDENGAIVNPASDEQIILLRRIVKLLESTAAADIAQRQRVTIDAITGSLTLATITTVGSITTLPALAAGTNTIGNVTVGGADQRQFIDIARNTYANSIRSKLTFS